MSKIIIPLFILLVNSCNSYQKNESTLKDGKKKIGFVYEFNNAPIVKYKIAVGPYHEGFNQEFYKDTWQTYYSDPYGKIEIPLNTAKLDSSYSKFSVYFWDSLSLIGVPQVFTLSNDFTDTTLKIRAVSFLYFKCSDSLAQSSIDSVKIKVIRTTYPNKSEFDYKILVRKTTPKSFMTDSVMTIELVKPGQTLEVIIQIGSKNQYRNKYDFKLGEKYIKYL